MLEKNQEPMEGQININADLPIHTMKSDLKNAGQAETPNLSAAAETAVPKSGESSPFLTQEEWQKSAVQQKEESFADGKKSGLGRSIMWGIIIFAALVVAAGAYYFWITRNSNPEDPSLSSLPPESKVPEIIPIQFSTNTPNYLTINDTDLSSISFLDKYSQQLVDSNIATSVEFILTDPANNPISFQDFSGKLGISLPESIMGKLKSPFSLFLFNDQGKTRIGLALSEVSGITLSLQTEVSKEELNLVRYFQPILSGDIQAGDNITFGESNYKGNTIKYANLTANNGLSIDYTFKNGQWLIGTSKATLRAMLDNIDKNYQPID